MNDLPNQPTPLLQAVRAMQMICASLVMGVLFAAAVILTMPHNQIGQPNEALQIIGYAFGAMALAMSPLLGGVIKHSTAKQALANGDATTLDLAAAYQTGMIVSLALNEGAAFFNLIAYWIAGSSPWNLALVGLLTLGNAWKFPTLSRVTDWIDTVQRRLKDEADLDRNDQ